MHFKIDFHVKLSEVYVTKGIGINLFSLHDAQTRQKIFLGKNDAHLFDGHFSHVTELDRLCSQPSLTKRQAQILMLYLLCLVTPPPRFL